MLTIHQRKYARLTESQRDEYRRKARARYVPKEQTLVSQTLQLRRVGRPRARTRDEAFRAINCWSMFLKEQMREIARELRDIEGADLLVDKLDEAAGYAQAWLEEHGR